MRYYATLGPSCCDTAVLAALLRRGVTGFRLNLSHTSLQPPTTPTLFLPLSILNPLKHP